MPAPHLISMRDAARRLGVPEAGLRRAAEAHGYLIRVGRAVRLREDELGELVELCREGRKAPASTSGQGETDRSDGSSSTRAGSSVQPALAAAEKLKRRSRPTSRKGTPAPVAELHPRK